MALGNLTERLAVFNHKLILGGDLSIKVDNGSETLEFDKLSDVEIYIEKLENNS